MLPSLIGAAAAGVGGAVAGIAKAKSNAPLAVASTALGLVTAIVSANQIKRRWVVADANEWLLVVRKGKLVKAGIGLSCFAGLNDVVVRFPSLLQKITFCAEQITKEMQGIRVSGFVVWSIHREADGPLKAYRYLDGLTDSGCLNANMSIANMAESIVRSCVANMTINEVVQNREALRDKCKREMSEVVKGWGVWLETVEVTEVTICSRSLFDDLQVEFRQKMRQQAELLRQATEQQLEESRIKRDSEVTRQRVDAETQAALYAAAQALLRQKDAAKNEEELHTMRLAKQARDNELAMKKAEDDDACERARMERRLQRELTVAQQEMALLRQRLQEEQQMGQASVQRMVCETTQAIYAKLPLRDVRLVNVAGGAAGGAAAGGVGGLDALLPGLLGMQMATQQAGASARD